MKDYSEMVYTKFGKYPTPIRSDEEGESIGKDTEAFLRGHGIKH